MTPFAIKQAIRAAIVGMNATDLGYRTGTADAWSVAQDESRFERRHLMALVALSSGRRLSIDAEELTVQVAFWHRNFQGTRDFQSEDVDAESAAIMACRHLHSVLEDLPLDGCCVTSDRWAVDLEEKREFWTCTVSFTLTTPTR